MTEAVTPFPADHGRAAATDIPEHAAGLLSDVDREAHDWVTRFGGGGAGPADLAAFKQWSTRDPAHAEAFARACRLWESIAPASELLNGKSGPVVGRLGPRLGRRAFLGGTAAAAAAAAVYVATDPPLGLWPSLSELAADYRTAPGEQRSLVLAEGASLDLNTRTSITVTTAADGTHRIELIGGEAAIATMAATHRTVEVVAARGQVAAVDASFNIRRQDGTVCTTCIDGEVHVVHGGRSAHLRRNEQVVYSAAGLETVVTTEPALVTAWKDGVLVFQSTPLTDAIAEINRYRSGRIIVTNSALARRLFSARFRIANIDEVVGQIQQVFGASVTTLPGGIVLLG